jgi:hypothetical protein
MNSITTKQYVGLIVVALVAGIIGAVAVRSADPQLGGSFAGGITPSQLMQADNTNNVVSPIGSFVTGAPNGLEVGANSVLNEITSIVVGTSTFNQFTLGTIGQNSSTATTTLVVNGNIPVGRSCLVSLTTAPTSTVYELNGTVMTSGATSTLLVNEVNFATANVTVATGTVYAECHGYAF